MQGVFGALVIVDGVTSICTSLSTSNILLTPNVHPGRVRALCLLLIRAVHVAFDAACQCVELTVS